MSHSPQQTAADLSPAAAVSLVIAGHGTRVNAGAAAAADLVTHVRRLLPGVRVEAGFVELTEPSIDAALDDVLAESGRAVVVPLMIGSGGHVRDDIPSAIELSRARHREAKVAYTRHLGAPAPLLAAVRERIDAARGDWASADTDVVLVGRGCSIAEANADHVRLSRLIFETGGYRQVAPAFIQVTRPALPEALAQAAASGSRRIVVMPHFLFTGRLDQWVHQQTADFAAAHPEVEVRVASVIGACAQLAEVVVQRYREGVLKLRAEAGSSAYLSGLLLTGRRVVAVGGGCVNRRRVPKLLAAGAEVTVVAPELHPALAALAEAGTIRWRERTFQDCDLDGAWYVLAATDDPATNAQVAAAAEARHTFCVRADRADQGSAWTPATATIDGLSVAVLAGGDPRRSRAVRDQLVSLYTSPAHKGTVPETSQNIPETQGTVPIPYQTPRPAHMGTVPISYQTPSPALVPPVTGTVPGTGGTKEASAGGAGAGETGADAGMYLKDGAEIYRQSFAIIEAETDLSRVPDGLRAAAIRMVHASGQPDLVDDLAWSDGFADAATAALRAGAPILCDAKMVASGVIRSRLPRDNQVLCLLGDPRLDALATELGTTKTAAAVELWRPLLPGAVVAIGNAPTALFHLLEVVAAEPSLAPAAVLGIPVGFVGAAESKQTLAANNLGLEYLVVHGRRGGSAVTVAALNALCGPDGRTG
jgi:siroheme synthase, N-terminal domain